MTAIVGLVFEGSIYLGADSSACDMENMMHVSRLEPKVFRNGQYLMGVAGQTRCGQVMHYVFNPPRVPSFVRGNAGVIEFMVREFVPALRDCLEEQGVTSGEVTDPFPGNVIIGVRDCLLELEPDFQVSVNIEPWAAAGAGSAYCLGALFAQKDTLLDPVTIIGNALDAAATYSMTVRTPFTVERLPND